MGQPVRHDKGHQGDASTSPMSERTAWLIAQGKVMLGLYQKSSTPHEQQQIRVELAELYKQLTQEAALLSRERRYQDLLPLLRLQLAITRPFGGRLTEGVLLSKIGTAHLALRQYPQALESLQEAIPILRETGDEAHIFNALHNCGEACRLLQQYEAAIDWYDQALAINPSRYASWFVKGDVLERLRRRDEAIACYQHCLQLHPGYEPARTALARLGIST